jgi:hypothetical protein
MSSRLIGGRSETRVNRLLQQIADQLAMESDSFKRAELRARQAWYYARTGDFDGSRAIVADLRKTYGDGRSGRVTAFMMIAEALTAHFESLDGQAMDRIKRAQLLGRAMGDREVLSLSTAWRAHMEFEVSDFAAAASSLTGALEAAEKSHYAARSRCAAVLHNAFAYLGDRTAAQKWFLRGREHALAEGDQATVDALLHNKAVCGVAYLWIQKCLGTEVGDRTVLARTELNSARNLELLVQVKALTSYTDLAEARLLMLEGSFGEAKKWLEALTRDGPFPIRHFNESLRVLMVAYCDVSQGNAQSAVAHLRSMRSDDLKKLDPDDCLFAAWMADHLAKTDRQYGDPASTAAAYEVAKTEYQATLQTHSELFARFADS